MRQKYATHANGVQFLNKLTLITYTRAQGRHTAEIAAQGGNTVLGQSSL